MARDSIVSMVAGVLGMIPEGLVLLTSVALTLGALVLANKKTLVQELYCIETLARVDTLCLDKTGTITEGSMRVERVEPFSLNMEKDSTESTDNSEVSEKKTSEDESVENSQTAADQETLTEKDEIKEIERIMCSMMSVLRDENATANALRRRFPAKASMECEHVIPFSSDRKYSGVVFHAEGTYLMGAAQFLSG